MDYSTADVDDICASARFLSGTPSFSLHFFLRFSFLFLLFMRVIEYCSKPASYPAITPHGHRGVSAFSFRDGAIPRSHRGVKNTKRRIARLRGLPKSARWLSRDNATRGSRRKRPFFSRRRDTFFRAYRRVERTKGGPPPLFFFYCASIVYPHCSTRTGVINLSRQG